MLDLLDLMQDNFEPTIEHIDDMLFSIHFIDDTREHEYEATCDKHEILRLRNNAHRLYRLLGEFTDYA